MLTQGPNLPADFGQTEKNAKESEMQKEIEAVLNKYSREKESDTPDFILAKFLINCLKAFEQSTNDRSFHFNKPMKFHGDTLLPMSPEGE